MLELHCLEFYQTVFSSILQMIVASCWEIQLFGLSHQVSTYNKMYDSIVKDDSVYSLPLGSSF